MLHRKFVAKCVYNQQENLKIMIKISNKFRFYGIACKRYAPNYLCKIKIIWHRLNELSKMH